MKRIIGPDGKVRLDDEGGCDYENWVPVRRPLPGPPKGVQQDEVPIVTPSEFVDSKWYVNYSGVPGGVHGGVVKRKPGRPEDPTSANFKKKRAAQKRANDAPANGTKMSTKPNLKKLKREAQIATQSNRLT